MRKPLALKNRTKPVKRLDSAANAKPRAIYIKTAAASRAFRSQPFDKRSKAYRVYAAHVSTLEQHLGGNLTPPQSRLVDQAARLALLAALTWDDIARHGALAKGNVRPAVEAYMKAVKEERQVLLLLGINRHIKELTLAEYLAAGNDGGDS